MANTQGILSKIKKLEKAHEAHKQIKDAYWKKEYALAGKRAKLVLKYILNVGLKETDWVVGLQWISSDGVKDYKITLMSSYDRVPKMMKIMKPEFHHMNTELEKGVTLYINDSAVDLHFDNSKIAQAFIAKYGLNINLDKVKREYAQAATKAEDLKHFLELNGESCDIKKILAQTENPA